MDSFNKINGIAQRFQWIRFLKASVLLNETDKLTTKNWRINCIFTAEKLSLSADFFHLNDSRA